MPFNASEMTRLLNAAEQAKALAQSMSLELDDNQRLTVVKALVSGIEPLFALASSGIKMPKGWAKQLNVNASQLEREWIQATESEVKALLKALAEQNIFPTEVNLHGVVCIWHRSETNRDIASRFVRNGKTHWRIAVYR